MTGKEGAWEFLSDLQSFLKASLPDKETIRKVVPDVANAAKSSTNNRHKSFLEGAFLNEYIAPAINKFLKENIGLDGDAARTAFLSESYKNINDWASGSPARAVSHPFRKSIGVPARDIIAQWKGSSSGNRLVQSCPDMALRAPAPIKVVIEGKYFSKGGIKAADTSLATDIYQAFFYLGLSHLPETKTHPAWDYDYSCLISYDATPKGSLITAWKNIDQKVKRGCWEGANIFVMILGENI